MKDFSKIADLYLLAIVVFGHTAQTREPLKTTYDRKKVRRRAERDVALQAIDAFRTKGGDLQIFLVEPKEGGILPRHKTYKRENTLITFPHTLLQ